MSNSKNFNLTKKKEFKKALDWSDTALMITNPALYLVIKGVSSLFNTNVPDDKQVDAAIKLIEAGKKNGLKKMKIKVSKDAGVKIQGSSLLDGFGVSAKILSSGEMELEVEYK